MNLKSLFTGGAVMELECYKTNSSNVKPHLLKPLSFIAEVKEQADIAFRM
jgi:hypothetical protein